MSNEKSKLNFQGAVLISLCFLLTSTAYLGWAYTVMKLASSRTADAVSLGGGYLFQAAGLGLFIFFCHRTGETLRKQLDRALCAVLALHMLCLVPARLTGSLVFAMLFGFLLNLLCGWIAGYYLFFLTAEADGGSRSVILGTGYGSAIIVSWLLTLIGKGSVYHSNSIFVICLVLTAAIIFLILKRPASGFDDKDPEETASSVKDIYLPRDIPLKSLLLSTGVLVFVFSIVNTCSFGFPSADILVGISVEFSRLFYAAGLIIAGFVSERSRKYGAVCALTALVIPFIMLALKGELVPQIIFWALSYFTFGFYSIYRMILFSDITGEKKLLWLAPFGLLVGRLGDAVGEGLYLALSGWFPVLIIVSALLFMAAVILFLRIYPLLYLPKSFPEKSEAEKFNHFAAMHDLSAREREVFRLILREKSTVEIADELSVSESTVKFHIHNLLQKTGCRNRIELLSAYSLKNST